MNVFDTKMHHRRSIRLPGYDYSHAGAYYVTIVAHERECLFGTVSDGKMNLNLYGQIVQSVWSELPKHYRNIELDAFCVMPNHVHAIINLIEDDLSKPQPLSEIVRAFKSFSARRINVLRKKTGIPVWQRNYYEHIVRNNEDYLAICDYIQNNPTNWQMDGNAPHA